MRLDCYITTSIRRSRQIVPHISKGSIENLLLLKIKGKAGVKPIGNNFNKFRESDLEEVLVNLRKHQKPIKN